MRMIRELILNLEEEANELDSVGNYKRAERNRILASKYRQMEYNGHLTIYDRINEDERR